MTIKCENWDSTEPQKLYDGDRCIGSLMPGSNAAQILSKETQAAVSKQPVAKVGPHKYLTIETDLRDGEKIAYVRISRRHPDESCECEGEDYDGEDIHDDIRMTLTLDLIRITDAAGLLNGG